MENCQRIPIKKQGTVVGGTKLQVGHLQVHDRVVRVPR